MAVVNTAWYSSSAGWAAMTAWATGTVKAAGAMVRQNAAPTVGNERAFVCIIAGTTHATTEPTWVVTQGAKTVDNTITWMEVTGKPGVNGDATNTPASSTARSQAVVLGNLIKNNAGTHLFICTTAGTCGAGEPSYGTTAGNTTADNTATWTCIGTVGAFTAWQAAGARLATSWATTGDTVYVSSSHAETQATAISIAPAGLVQFLCVANGGTIPPTAADLTTGASVTTTGNSTITIGQSYYQGITFNCATGAFAASLNVGTAINTYVSMRNCALNLKGTANPTITFGNATGSKIELVNTTLGFAGGTGEVLTFSGCQFLWRDTPSALSAVGGVWPNNPFRANQGTLLIENVDLSAFAGSGYWNVNAGPSKSVFSRCKLANLPIIGAATAGHAEIDLIDCDTGGVTYRHERWQPYEGNQTIETAAVHTGGASDGTTTYSWKITTLTTARWQFPFESLPIAIWNATTVGNVTVTLEGLASASTNNDDVWLQVNYLGTAGSTLGSHASSNKASALTAAAVLTQSTVAWDGGATARQNSHLYAVNEFLKVASNPGRIFKCAIGGTSAASEPGGYATAVDGGDVTDGTATFRCMWRFKLAVTVAPQVAAYLACKVRVGRPSSIYYIDPKAVLT